MDTYFLSHRGSPMLAVDDTIPGLLRIVAAGRGDEEARPRAIPILVVSAHWETAAPAVSVVRGSNGTIHDFYGFPAPMYQLKYPAPGARELAKRTKVLLEQAGLGPVEEDHGAWVPLMLMYPAADIPVCQLYVQPGRDEAHHHAVGRALAPLREEGVLRHAQPAPEGHPPLAAAEFDAWLHGALLGGRYDDAVRGDGADMATEHLYPLHVALGAANANGGAVRAELIHHSWTGSLSYASYKFTTTS
uniref:Extradiol ring-cleavage dioxygenase class III enzyme subunit B domain-containing protein n=1 Tax=Setaria viridis TaxID=4556 RepID=A0A4U6VWM0_SETVI|nr:LOW QUALITY PROTEIN: hypothetical protein SEVIR_2G165900v2 [Setaria viridis]